MRRRLFALLEDRALNGVQNIKIAYLVERAIGDSYDHGFEPYTPLESESFTLTMCDARDKRAQMENIRAGSTHIRIWRTPFTVKHMGQWLPVLDCDHRYYIPGEFVYSSITTQQMSENRLLQQLNARMTLDAQIVETAYKTETTAKVHADSIPRFIMEILKRDAVAKKYECPISMTIIEQDTEVSFTECFHIFEREGIERWVREKSSCPLCKAKVTRLQHF
jgi:hypothetical protein